MVIDLQYLPNLEFFCAIHKNDEIIIEAYEFYEKQSYRNRSRILTTNKVDTLTIPVQKDKKKIIVKDVKIDYSQDWIRRHWGAIHAGYGKSPFFEFYSDYFRKILDKKHDFLFDLNIELLTICLKLLRLEKKIIFTENYQKNPQRDFRGLIHPKKSYILNDIYYPFKYRQNFGNEFEPNLSILDLLFCQGNQSLLIISDSTIK